MTYLLFPLLLALPLMAAPTDPQLTWEGYVSGGVTLYVQQDHVDAQGRDTGAIDRPRYKFTSSLPALRQHVSVEVVRGSGTVKITEQPVPENEYAAVVEIAPSAKRPEFYVVAFRWEAAGKSVRSSPTLPAKTGAGQITWTGEVDGEAVIEFRGRRSLIRVVEGRPVAGERAVFTALRPRGAAVRLTDVRGRGTVELVESPDAEKADTIQVRIVDPQNGSSAYSFRLVWDSGKK